MSCLYILEIKPLSVVSFIIIFSQSVGCLFILFMVSYAVQKFVSWNRSHCAFISIALGNWLKKSLVGFMSENVCLCFLPGFLWCHVIFKLLNHFEFIFVSGVRACSNFIDLQAAVQLSQHHLLKRLSFFHCIFLPPLSKINWPLVCGFISGLSVLFHWSICLFLCQYHAVLITVGL